MSIAQTVVNGILIGGLMALAAVGFTLIFGVMGVLNLTHGVVVIMGGYIAYFAWMVFGIDPFLSVPICLGTMFLFGFFYQRAIIQRVVDKDDLVILLVTYGVAIVIRNLIEIFLSPNSRSINPPYATDSFTVASVTVPFVRAVASGVGLVLILAVFVLIYRTQFGLAVRATAESTTDARLCGIDVERIYAVTFGLATALSGASGALIGIVLPFSPATELFWTLNAFVVVVLGGLGSLVGSLIGGLIIGLLNAFTTQYVGSTWVQLVFFSLLVVILVLRPQGLFGQPEDIE